jgi:hypothetical protein
MRALDVVVFDEGLGDPTSLLQVSRPLQSEALLLRGPVVALDECILWGMVSSADLDFNPQASRHPRTRAAGKSLPAGLPTRAVDHDPR